MHISRQLSIIIILGVYLIGASGFSQSHQIPKIALMQIETRGEATADDVEKIKTMLISCMQRIGSCPVVDISLYANQRITELKKKHNLQIFLHSVLAKLDSIYALKITAENHLLMARHSPISLSFPDQQEQIEKAITILLSQLDIGPNELVLPNDSTGVVKILSDPDSSIVFLNEQFIGTTPMQVGFLKPGEHTIRLQKSGYKNLTGTVVVKNNAASTYKAELARYVNVRFHSNQPNVKIYINGSPVGVTPKSVVLTAQQKYRFRFETDAFEPLIEEKAFGKDQSVNIDFQKSYKKWWYLAGGTTAVLGLIYFLNGDDNPEQDLGGGLPAPPGRP